LPQDEDECEPPLPFLTGVLDIDSLYASSRSPSRFRCFFEAAYVIFFDGLANDEGAIPKFADTQCACYLCLLEVLFADPIYFFVVVAVVDRD
jgi:hypothetical protein